MRRGLAPHRGGYYSTAEEVAHAVTHGVGCLAAMAGLVVLVMQAAARGETWEIVGAAIFGATLMTLLPEMLHSFAEFEMLVYGLILMSVMIFLPRGLTRGLMDIYERVKRKNG